MPRVILSAEVPLRYCAWDSVGADGSFRPKCIDTEWPERQRRRLAFLEIPRDGAPDAALTDPKIPAELSARLGYWRPGSHQARRGTRMGCLFMGLGICLVIRLFVAPGYAFLVANPLVFFGLLVMLLALAIPLDVRARRRWRAFAPLVKDLCGTCGYDLNALSMHSVAGEHVRLGPSACPECGAPWPLVPPPVPFAPHQPSRPATPSPGVFRGG